MNTDGNIGTILQWCMADLHTPGIEDVVRRYCVEAMNFHRNKRYFFSDKEVSFNLVEGKRTYEPGDGYGLPKDMVEIVGRTIWILIGGSEDQMEPCTRTQSDVFDEQVAGWGTSTSQPDEWDFKHGKLRFNPAPNSSDDVARLTYVSNLLIPKVKYESSLAAFEYYDPVSGVKLSSIDEWVNDWTEQEKGQAAIRHRTMYLVQKNYLRDAEGANESLTGWLECVAQLEDETEQKVSGLTYLEGSLF